MVNEKSMESAKQRSNFLFFEQVSSTHKSRRDEMFIDTRLLTLTAPEERNVYRAFVSLLL